MSEAAASHQLDSNATVTTIPVNTQRTVCYQFDTRASDQPNLAIPYLVIVNRHVQNKGNPRKLDSGRTIKLTVAAGSKVALYLNSDVHPNYRCLPIYEVEVNDNDALIRITEQRGRIRHLRPIVGHPTLRAANNSGGRATDCYQAYLTGDIWMAISHRYTEAEAEALLSDDTPAAAREAVRSIYRGLQTCRLIILSSDPSNGRVLQLRVNFEEHGNPQEHIVECSTPRDVLTRTHPRAFEALFSEACKLGITDMLITSCWRPFYGSIVHRAGLGLDVSYIATTDQKVKINRVGLTEKGRSRNPNVTENEKALRAVYLELSQKTKQNPTDAQAHMDAATAYITLEKEVDRNEPKVMRELRDCLREHRAIQQILDPWYMDVNTHDKQAPTVNQQQSSLERGHAHHLHMTIREPKIYD